MKRFSRRHVVAGIAVVVLTIATWATVSIAQASATSHFADLTASTADVTADGTVVVTFIATGEMRGLVTLQLKQTSQGTYDGQWAFTVSHVDTSDPETGLEPEHHEDAAEGEGHHKDFVRMIHRGSLSGTVAAAIVSINSDGALLDVLAPLAIDNGASEFAGATGSGQATLTSLSLLF